MSDLQPAAQSSQRLIASLSSSSISTSQRQAATYAAERARLLFGQFRKGDANDPDTYVASIAAVLARYDADIIRTVTDPRTGLASRLAWLPNVKEVRDACEAIEAPRRRAAERAAQAARQQQELAEFEKKRGAAPSREDLRARGFLKPPTVRPISADALWTMWKQQRAIYGPRVSLSPEARMLLLNAGYDPDEVTAA